MDTLRRLQFLRRTAYLFLAIGIALSIPLWLNQRLFPLIPVHESWPLFSSPVDTIFLVLLGVGILTNIFLNDRRLQIATLVILLLLLLQDQMRWQPWVYTYLLVSIVFIFIPHKNDKDFANNHIWIIRSVQILLIGIYLWSGLNKLNPGFTEVTYRLMLQKLFGLPEGSQLHEATWVGYFIPIMESAVAVGLFFVRTRKFAIWGAVFTHLIIISYLISMGEDGNPIVIPWNIAMVLFVLLAFFQMDNTIRFTSTNEPTKGKKKSKQKQSSNNQNAAIVMIVIAVISCLFPVLRFAGKWDNYLSFNLYSDNIKYLYMGVRGEALESLPDQLNQYYAPYNPLPEGQTIDIFAWSFDELNVPVYPEKRVYKAISKHFCDQDSQAAQNYMFIEYQLPFREGNYEVFPCGAYD
jgi:hypothetical protein